VREKCSTHGEKRNKILLQNAKARNLGVLDVDRGHIEKKNLRNRISILGLIHVTHDRSSGGLLY
jgi:hypothetical protein